MPNERISMSKLKQLIGLTGAQFKRPGARADARTVGGRGLEVPAGGARVRDRGDGLRPAKRGSPPFIPRSHEIASQSTKVRIKQHRARVPQTAETTPTRSPRGLFGSRALRLGLAIRPRVSVPPPPRKRPPSASSYPHTEVHQQCIHAAASVFRARAQSTIRLAPRFIGSAAPIHHVVHDTALLPAPPRPQAASISREFVRWSPASFPCALGLGVLLQPALVVHDSSDEIGRSEGATNRRTRHTCERQYAHQNAEARRLHQSRFMSYCIS